MSDLGDVELVIRSRVPLILVQSREEPRVVELFRRVARRQGIPLYRWMASTGLQRLDEAETAPATRLKPAEALAHIRTLSTPGIFLLLDFHPYLKDPLTVRLVRDIAQQHERTGQTIVLTSPELELPRELSHHAAQFDLSLPDQAALEQLITDEARAWTRRNPGRRVQARSAALKSLTRNLVGLTLADARRLVRSAIADDGAITDDDVHRLIQAKYQLLDQGGVLSFELDSVAMADVAGLDNLKRWLERRHEIFLSADPPPGLDPPKGVLLLGVQGSGKSLAAKAVAGAWGVPLLRLDFATLYNKYYGETERNLRESLKTAGMMAPCVLWIDEIEKGLAVDEDGGPSRRILGTLLTWMAERKERVFFVATANDIQALPPELLRKGRFDEIFFVDLPSAEVRSVIFRIHLARRGQDLAAFDLDELAQAAQGFSGAEIEQAVVSGLYTAHAKKEKLGMEHLRQELAGTRPLSVLMAEDIAHLRAWAAQRTVPA